MVPNQIKRLLKISNNNPLLSHTKIPPNHNIFLYIYIYIYFPSATTKAPKIRPSLLLLCRHVGHPQFHVFLCLFLFFLFLFLFTGQTSLTFLFTSTKINKQIIIISRRKKEVELCFVNDFSLICFCYTRDSMSNLQTCLDY